MLMHHVDAGANGVVRRANGCGRAADPDFAGVRLIVAVEDAHQGRLAGAVLADDAMDAAPPHLEPDVAIGVHRAETLVDAA